MHVSKTVTKYKKKQKKKRKEKKKQQQQHAHKKHTQNHSNVLFLKTYYINYF